ncbi:triosephosphate isomerase [Candidatus Microgenomates bacterium]|nr:triosephosphate isomerase [Candidatus Microgenomates bacterium]
MSPSSFAKAKGLMAAYNKALTGRKNQKSQGKAEVIICPPFLYFQMVDERRSRLMHLGAQNVFWKGQGPYTGQISARMVNEFGAEYVLVGHSESRRLGDTDVIVATKVREILKNNMTPIICVGYKDFVRETKSIVNNFSAEEIGNMFFAYEPIGSIGTLKPAHPEQVGKAIRSIKNIIFRRFRRKYFFGMVGIGGSKNMVPQPVVLYGGSINGENFRDYLEMSELSGFIIGRESFRPESLKKMVQKIEQQ